MHNVWTRAVAVACALIAFADFSYAGSTVIGGKRLSCPKTRVEINYNAPGAMARPGLIVLNPDELDDLPVIARQFAFLHECGHQYAGDGEIAADCWAVRRGKRIGLLNRRNFATACRAVAALPGGPEHPPGPTRCRQMRRCYARAPGPAVAKVPKPIVAPKPRIVVALTPTEAGALWDLIRKTPGIVLNASVVEGLQAAANLKARRR